MCGLPINAAVPERPLRTTSRLASTSAVADRGHPADTMRAPPGHAGLPGDMVRVLPCRAFVMHTARGLWGPGARHGRAARGPLVRTAKDSLVAGGLLVRSARVNLAKDGLLVRTPRIDLAPVDLLIRTARADLAAG